MSCGKCNEGRVYDAHCLACNVRHVRACRSVVAPKVAVKAQKVVLASIGNLAGDEMREATISRLKAARDAMAMTGAGT